MASSTSTASNGAPAVPVTAITGGVIGGVLFLLMLVILILVLALLVFRWRRTKIFDVQGNDSKLKISSACFFMTERTASYLSSSPFLILHVEHWNARNRPGDETIKDLP